MKFAGNFFYMVAGIILFSACTTPSETHRYGETKIFIEESYKPLFTTSIDTYESLYQKAHITPVYCTEAMAIDSFIANKTKTLFITRDFTDEEKARLKKQQVEVRSEPIAKDAVVLIVHPSNTDTNMTVDQVKSILKGNQKEWSTSKNKINIVFDNQNSANFIYMRNLTDNAPIPPNMFAVNSNEEVLNYVKEHPNSMGIIGANWISDQDDTTVLNFLKGISVIGLSADDSGNYYKPYQAYIYTKEYPFTRELWAINKGSRSGLNTGFVLFLSGEKGQLIIQKSGLIPATAQIRMINFQTE